MSNPARVLGIEPRPYDSGYWGAFGHVTIDGTFWASVKFGNTGYGLGYLIDYRATYEIDDTYEWFANKATPIPILGSVGAQIPHAWAISLADDGRAAYYDFKITWTETGSVFLTQDRKLFLSDDGYLMRFHPSPNNNVFIPTLHRRNP